MKTVLTIVKHAMTLLIEVLHLNVLAMMDYMMIKSKMIANNVILSVLLAKIQLIIVCHVLTDIIMNLAKILKQ